jgi:hypothetical protein
MRGRIGEIFTRALLVRLKKYAKSSLSFSSLSKWSVSKAIDDRLETPSEERLLGAFETLRGCVCDGCPPKGKPTLADVFIAFDEAHQLTEPWDNGSTLSNYTELQQVLRIFSKASLFTFFVSAHGEISQFAMPRTGDPSDRILQGGFYTPRPFVELGFDQLMWNRKILDEYKTLEEVTSSECIAHMGRPLYVPTYRVLLSSHHSFSDGAQCMIMATTKSASTCSFSRFKNYLAVQ